MVDLTRTTKHILKFANAQKQLVLDKLFQGYEKALEECISLIYSGELPHKRLLSSTLLPEKLGDITHSRWKQVVYKHASDILRGAKETAEHQRRQRYKRVYAYFSKRKRQTKFTSLHFHELKLRKYSKPGIKSVSIYIDARFTDFKKGESFDEFLRLSTPYFTEGKKRSVKINIPIKHTQMDNRYKYWKRCHTIVLEKINGSYYIDYIYQKEAPELKAEGITLGIDFGVKKLLTTSRREFLGTKIGQICSELTKCKRGSNHYKSLLRKRNQYIDSAVNSLDLVGVKKVVVEDLRTLKRSSGKKNKNTKSFRNLFQYCSVGRTFANIEKRCMEQGIELVKVLPYYTSQTCSRCGSIDKSSRNGERYHCCTCGYEIDADYNASLNILQRGVYSPPYIEKGIT